MMNYAIIKTKFLMNGTKAQLRKVNQTSLNVGELEIVFSDDAIRTLGVWFGNAFSTFYHLHNIRSIRKDLFMNSTVRLSMLLSQVANNVVTDSYMDFLMI